MSDTDRDSVFGDASDGGTARLDSTRRPRKRQPSIPEAMKTLQEKEQRKAKKPKHGSKEESPDVHACTLSGESLAAVKSIVDEGVGKVLSQIEKRFESFEKRIEILEGEIFEKDKDVSSM